MPAFTSHSPAISKQLRPRNATACTARTQQSKQSEYSGTCSNYWSRSSLFTLHSSLSLFTLPPSSSSSLSATATSDSEQSLPHCPSSRNSSTTASFPSYLVLTLPLARPCPGRPAIISAPSSRRTSQPAIIHSLSSSCPPTRLAARGTDRFVFQAGARRGYDRPALGTVPQHHEERRGCTLSSSATPSHPPTPAKPCPSS